MNLNKRNKKMFKFLIESPNMTSKELGLKLNLTKRQITYGINKINFWLTKNNYPEIKRLKNGQFILSSSHYEMFKITEYKDYTTYIFSEKERRLLIIYMLLSQFDLSLFHFTSALRVSNVTIINDMKKVQEYIRPYHLEVVYFRKSGYFMEGDEWEKRNLLQYVTEYIYHNCDGIALLEEFSTDSKESIHYFRKKLTEIEYYLDIRFTDEKIELMPFIFIVIFNRVSRKHYINFDYQIQFNELSGTKEYAAAQLLLKKFNSFPERERLYITLHILSANIFSENNQNKTELPDFKKGIEEMLINFENLAFIKFKNKSYLVNKLMMHLKPAYYRIKYNLSSYEHPVLKLDEENLKLDLLVKNSLKPLEEILKVEVPDSERLYITLFIGGHLIAMNQSIPLKKNAIVICGNGVVISKLLKNTLSQLFPEFSFFKTMTIREFQNSSNPEIEVVFTPEPINFDTTVHVFVVKPILSKLDKWHLRQRVLKSIYGYKLDDFSEEKLLMIIKQYARVLDEEKLMKELTHYLKYDDATKYLEPNYSSQNLPDILQPGNITIVKNVTDWKEAIEIAARPLINDKVIQSSYVEKMIKSHDYQHPYMILGESIAIPHAESVYGVNTLGISLLIIKDGVNFSKDKKIFFVFVLALTSTEEHITAIHQLTEISMNKCFLKELLKQKDTQLVWDKLRHFLNEGSHSSYQNNY